MQTLIARSPNGDALRAELHRDELLREAAASRIARSAAQTTAGPGFAARIRAAFGSWGEPVQQAECGESA